MEITDSEPVIAADSGDGGIRSALVANNPNSPEFWAFWAKVREQTCPESTFYDWED